MIPIQELILKTSASQSILSEEIVQQLWSDYGNIKRYHLKGGKQPSVIVKHIQLPEKNQHPKGWNTNLSHQRKLTSYRVERQWYKHYAQQTDITCRVPQIYHTAESENELLLIMEDLDASGYAKRLHHKKVTLLHAESCLTWLAHFHAKFMNNSAAGLWPVGTYWHLETRPDEWEKMENIELKEAAKTVSDRLQNAQYQTLIHRDAKLANFCFGEQKEVAAVDFQYVGKGCGMKDVAYFISSCFEADKCEQYEEELLTHYFKQLELSLDKDIDFQELKMEWSTLYRYAWADFYRFLDGWSSGHWKMHFYSKKLTQIVLNELKTT